MVEQKKVILMTKLALYEKKHIKEDKARTNYYIEDYIYTNNFKTRFGITLIMLLFVALGAVKILVTDFIFPTSLLHFIEVYISPYLFPWVLLLVIYTFISTSVYGYKYEKSRRRISKYNKLLRELGHYERQQEKNGEESDEFESDYIGN